MALTVAEKDLKKRELFLEGNILKGVLTVCVPMAAFQLLNELFRVFDLAITARINPESVAAVSQPAKQLGDSRGNRPFHRSRNPYCRILWRRRL